MTNKAMTQKDSRLSIRASETEKAMLRAAAEARRMNTSDFVRQASLDAAQAVLTEQTTFQLPKEKWAEFCARLDAPARTIPALRQLFSECEPYGE
jgi:uncharacterized protein (DUF1778 family)